jgi:5-methylcytosine-specific restriction endonuclease McrBC regulatory subunit McrC
VWPKRRGYLAHDEAGRLFQYENDALMESRLDGQRIIVDMKYKSVDLDNREAKYGVAQEDLYQMIAYATKRGIRNVLLVYPGCGKAPPSHQWLVVNNALGGWRIRITACKIPMDNTDRQAIRETLEAAAGALGYCGTAISAESTGTSANEVGASLEVEVGEAGQQ